MFIFYVFPFWLGAYRQQDPCINPKICYPFYAEWRKWPRPRTHDWCRDRVICLESMRCKVVHFPVDLTTPTRSENWKCFCMHPFLALISWFFDHSCEQVHIIIIIILIMPREAQRSWTGIAKCTWSFRPPNPRITDVLSIELQPQDQCSRGSQNAWEVGCFPDNLNCYYFWQRGSEWS